MFNTTHIYTLEMELEFVLEFYVLTFNYIQTWFGFTISIDIFLIICPVFLGKKYLSLLVLMQ